MHLTCRAGSPDSQLAFWLMIVSIAIAVFPVCRSPMISWRWPRPIGVIASIALIPVCSGSCTGCRCTTEGAWTSRGRSVWSLISPRPSSGSPSGLTMRPRNESPTGTDSTSPVRRTRCPSSIPENSPRITTPISRTSRFSAMPRIPFSNSRSSFAMAEGSPSTRAMPSPASTTVPISSRATPAGSYSSTNRASASRISSGRIVSSAIFPIPFVYSWAGYPAGRPGPTSRRPNQASSACEFAPDLGQAAGRGPVYQLIPDLDGHATYDRGIVHDIQVNSLTISRGERFREPTPLAGGQLGGDSHHRDELFPPPGRYSGGQVERCLRGTTPGVRQQLRDQAHRRRADLALQQVGQQVTLGIRWPGPDQRRPQGRLSGHQAAEPEQVVLQVVQPTPALRGYRERFDGELLDRVGKVAGAGPAGRDGLRDKLLGFRGACRGGRRGPLGQPRRPCRRDRAARYRSVHDIRAAQAQAG